MVDAQQSLAADGAVACFSSSLFLRDLNADRAPQLKASVMPLRFDVELESSMIRGSVKSSNLSPRFLGMARR